MNPKTTWSLIAIIQLTAAFMLFLAGITVAAVLMTISFLCSVIVATQGSLQ